MTLLSLRDMVDISKATWSPNNSSETKVRHYSLPNFDLGLANLENPKSIKSNKFLLTEPCILISKLNPGTPRVWLIEELQAGINICSTEFVVLVPKKIGDIRFIYFILKSEKTRVYLRERATGTSNSHQRVLPDEVLKVESYWPEKSQVRHEISNFLWAIESKTQVNLESSQVLEKISQTIFKSWFIDFDPVMAKMAGEKPVGMDAATAALFPDSMGDSELGLIPKGWAAENLGNTCDIKQGRYLSPSQMSEVPSENAYVPVIGGNGVLGYTNASTFEFDVPLITCRGSKCGLLQWGITPTWISNNAMAVSMKVSSRHSQFLYQYFQQSSFENVITGSAQPQITITNLSYMKLVLPRLEILNAFTDTVESSQRMCISLSRENEVLRDIRDALLPRLISGELQIPEEMLA